MKKDLNQEKPAIMKEIVVAAKLENLHTVQDFISDVLESSSEFPADFTAQVILAAEEVFVNIARFAYGQNAVVGGEPLPEVGTVTIRVAVNKNKVSKNNISIEYEDSGEPFNPLEADNPDITLSIEERDVGGLGIFMVKNLMDDVKYRYKDNKNILILIKNS